MEFSKGFLKFEDLIINLNKCTHVVCGEWENGQSSIEFHFHDNISLTSNIYDSIEEGEKIFKEIFQTIKKG